MKKAPPKPLPPPVHPIERMKDSFFDIRCLMLGVVCGFVACLLVMG